MKTQAILFIAALAFIIGSSIANADGDRHRDGSPILPPGDNDCVYTLPSGIDLDNCVVLDAPEHSQIIYLCDGLEGDVTVICDED